MSPAITTTQRLLWVVLVTLLLSYSTANYATDPLPTVRLATLQFGTASWEIDVIKHHNLDRKNGFLLHVTPLASKPSTIVALQSKATDMILSDWIWVSRRRNAGQLLSFFPYSKGVGGLVVPKGSSIRSIADLPGKRVGIAGGPIDRNWLLIQALAKQQFKLDLDQSVNKVFGAPPLLYQKVLAGELDAVINFWHYVAKLETKGMRTVLSMSEAVEQLGFDNDIPMLGYVFYQDWARKNPQLIHAMMNASREAKQILNTSNAEWQRLRPRLKANGEAEFIALREGFRKGTPSSQQITHPEKVSGLYALIAALINQQATITSTDLAKGTFYIPPSQQSEQP